MKLLRFSSSGTVLVTDDEFEALQLRSRAVQTTWAARIQSHIGNAPLLEGRENSVRVALVVEESKEELVTA